ncbi:MAG: hypothetical protein AAF628_16605 [Planctomycetota bacterium]
MNRLSLSLLIASCAAPLTAQKDHIVWTDGTITRDCRITDFTWREVKFTDQGRSEAKPADAVARLHVEKVQNAFKRALAATSKDDKYLEFRRQAEKLSKSDPFLAQFGYVEASRLLVQNGQLGEAFALLEKMESELPDAGLRPEVYRIKMDVQLARGDAASAKVVAKKYADTALQQGWPDGFVHEAEYFSIMARAAAEELDAGGRRAEMETLLGKTDGSFPSVADRARVQLANAARDGGRVDEALEAYEQVLNKAGVDEGTRAEALIGQGHAHLKQGDPSNTEPYREAMLAFLRVYLETESAPAERKAEALHFAAEACDKWRGPDAGQMARRLRGFLRRDYAETSWASRR